MSVIIAFYFLLHKFGVHGLPVLQIEQRAPSNHDPNSGYRTTWMIIWSCIATIFAATWISAHPNIPKPLSAEKKKRLSWPETQFRNASPRLQIMVAGLIAPELVIFWAYRQRRMASHLANKYKGWSMSHGFFAIMGGFMLYDREQPRRTILPKDLDYYFARRIDPELPTDSNKIVILKEEIQDKSKGDFLSKLIAVGQAGWFMVQCFARRMAKLPLTDLELVTLAFVIPNTVVYALWWYKPIDVRQPHRIQGNVAEKDSTEDEGDKISAGWRLIWRATCDIIPRVVYNLYPWRSKEKCSCNPDARNEWPLCLRGLMNRFMTISALNRDMGWVDLGSVKKVPIWYAGEVWSDDDELGKHILRHATYVGVTIATIFGAVHCIGWSYEFPSRTELLLWRISSLAITSTPLLVFVVYHFVADQHGYLSRLLCTFTVICVAFYFISRVTILVLAFTAMRSLPQKAYQDVSWRHIISTT